MAAAVRDYTCLFLVLGTGATIATIATMRDSLVLAVTRAYGHPIRPHRTQQMRDRP